VQGTQQDMRDHLGVHVRPLGRDERADMTVPEAVDRMVVPVAVLRCSRAGRGALVRGARLRRAAEGELGQQALVTAFRAPGPSGGGPEVTASVSAWARSIISAVISPIRLPNRWKTVPLPTPAASATCSIEMSRGRCVASRSSVAARIARRLRTASARSGRAWLIDIFS
jgi:hypothetical protein